jgi:hypothetical protein
MSFLIKSYQEYCYVVTIGFDSMLPGHSLYSYQWVGEAIGFDSMLPGHSLYSYQWVGEAIVDCVVTRAFVSFSFMYPNAIQVLL